MSVSCIICINRHKFGPSVFMTKHESLHDVCVHRTLELLRKDHPFTVFVSRDFTTHPGQTETVTEKVGTAPWN